MAAAPHYVAYKPDGKASHCAVGKKGQGLAAEMEKGGMGYVVREFKKEVCPICNPKPENQDKPKQEGPPPEAIRPGQCHNCRESRPGLFKLTFENHKMVRTCRDCESRFDVHTLKPMEG